MGVPCQTAKDATISVAARRSTQRIDRLLTLYERTRKNIFAGYIKRVCIDFSNYYAAKKKRAGQAGALKVYSVLN